MDGHLSNTHDRLRQYNFKNMTIDDKKNIFSNNNKQRQPFHRLVIIVTV